MRHSHQRPASCFFTSFLSSSHFDYFSSLPTDVDLQVPLWRKEPAREMNLLGNVLSVLPEFLHRGFTRLFLNFPGHWISKRSRSNQEFFRGTRKMHTMEGLHHVYPLVSRSPGRLLVVAHRPLRRLSLSPASSFISVGKTLSCVPHQVHTGCSSLLSV